MSRGWTVMVSSFKVDGGMESNEVKSDHNRRQMRLRDLYHEHGNPSGWMARHAM